MRCAVEPLGLKVRFAAPTGRAAQRLAESTGTEASTIHRLLGIGLDDAVSGEPLDADLVRKPGSREQGREKGKKRGGGGLACLDGVKCRCFFSVLPGLLLTCIPLSFQVVVDEVSMLDMHVFTTLLRAMPLKASLVLVGDVDQLPPIGPGDILRDLVTSGTVRVARLTEIYRQVCAAAM